MTTASSINVIAFMTIPPSDDDSEALHWLTMARRVLSGEIAPQEARRIIDSAATQRTTAPLPDAASTLHSSL